MTVETEDLEHVYDPVKAHEYYMKNRELRGAVTPQKGETKEQRKARVSTSQKQREGRMYVNNQLSKQRQAETKDMQSAQQVRLDAIRKNAEASRARIEGKLNTFLQELTAKAKPVKLIPLNEIPSNASPRVRAFWERQNANIVKSNRDAVEKSNAANAAKKNTAKAQAAAEMKRVGSELKNAVAEARATYEESKKQMREKYKLAAETEHKNIKANVR